MTTRAAHLLLLALAFTLPIAACGQPEEQKGRLSADEERRLDNAAKMLDDNMMVVAPAEEELVNETARNAQ